MSDEQDEQADAQRFTERWIAQSLDIAPLTEVDRRRVVDGLRRIYHSQGVGWPEHVVWTKSPRELAAAADRSDSLITQWLKADPARWAEYRQSRRRRVARRIMRPLIGLLVFVTAFVLISVWWVSELAPIGALILGITAARRSFRRPDDRHRMEYEELFTPRSSLRNSSLDTEIRAHRNPASTVEAADRIDRAVNSALSGIWSSIWAGWNIRGGHDPGMVQVFTQTRKLREGEVGQIWLNQVGRAGLPPGDQELLESWEEVHRAFGWIAYRSLTLICEPPLELHTERVQDRHQLHNAEGPAVVWADAPEDDDYYLHGVGIPKQLYRAGAAVEDLRTEPSRGSAARPAPKVQFYV